MCEKGVMLYVLAEKYILTKSTRAVMQKVPVLL